MATISKIAAQNFLSLENLELHLGKLNVLVGPNGAGKSNILKAFHFLGDVARLDLLPAIEAVGGIEALLFRGASRKANAIRLTFEGQISQHASAKAPDEYSLTFWQVRARTGKGEERRLLQRRESIVIKRTAGRGRRITLSGTNLKIVPQGPEGGAPAPTPLTLQSTATGLATIRRLGKEYEADGVEAIAQTFEQLRLFEIDVERIRRPSRIGRVTRLLPDASNLAPYLLTLSIERPELFDRISADVATVLPGFMGFDFQPLGGAEDAISLHIVEDKLKGTTPLARTSYGTIRAIALFSMLHDPEPPRLTCLEEVDHGLHPHALDLLVDRIREASAKTQIILATHSPALVNRFSSEELIIVERQPETGGTRAFRPDQRLVQSLEQETGYGLGELWFSGSLGGVI